MLRATCSVLVVAVLAPSCASHEATMIDSRVADSGVDPDALDAAQTGDAGCEAHDAAVCCTRRRLFLDFEGASLVAAATDDARIDHSYLITSDKTVPPFLAGAADRDTVIAAIVAQLEQELAGHDVVVMQTRPATYDYMMVVFGGNSAAILGQSGIAALGPLDCGDTTRNDVILVFDADNAVVAANGAMHGLGAAIGLSNTTLANDCLAMSIAASPCTLSASAPVAPVACPGAGATQDEPAAFTTDLACR